MSKLNSALIQLYFNSSLVSTLIQINLDTTLTQPQLNHNSTLSQPQINLILNLISTSN